MEQQAMGKDNFIRRLRKKWKNTKVGNRVVVIVLLVVLMALLVTGAWYVVMRFRTIATSKPNVMTPYFLYLLDPKDDSSLSLTIGNIHPGETKREVICISNEDPSHAESDYEIAKASEFAYQMELAYTQNLPVEFVIYQLVLDEEMTKTAFDALSTAEQNKYAVVEKTDTEHTLLFLKKQDAPMTYSDVTALRREEVFGADTAEKPWSEIVNLGGYRSYETSTIPGDAGKLMLHTSIEAVVDGETGDTVEQTNYEKDYYLVEIAFPNDIPFAEYQKESDLLYFIVKAKQPRPEEM